MSYRNQPKTDTAVDLPGGHWWDISPTGGLVYDGHSADGREAVLALGADWFDDPLGMTVSVVDPETGEIRTVNPNDRPAQEDSINRRRPGDEIAKARRAGVVGTLVPDADCEAKPSGTGIDTRLAHGLRMAWLRLGGGIVAVGCGLPKGADDGKPGGLVALERISRHEGVAHDTFSVLTPSGGTVLFYRASPGQLAALRPGTGAVGTLDGVRYAAGVPVGLSGVVVAPGSRNRDGIAWCVLCRRQVAPLPDWLFRVLAGLYPAGGSVSGRGDGAPVLEGVTLW